MRFSYLLVAAPLAFACVGDSTVAPNDGGSDITTANDSSQDVASESAVDAGWTPAVLDADGSLALWLEASSGNVVISSGNVGVWKDLSKNHNDASNGAGGPTVHGGAINGHDSLVFAQYGVGLTIADNASLQFGSTQLVILAVAKAAKPLLYLFSKARTMLGGAGLSFYSGIQFGCVARTLDGGTALTSEIKLLDDPTDSGTLNGITQDWAGSVYDDGHFHIVGMRRMTSSQVELIVDDATPQPMTTTGPNVSAVGDNAIIGSRVYGNFPNTIQGEIAELVIVHASVIGDSVLASLHAYLKAKFAL